MRRAGWLWTGTVGTLVCCFTPVLGGLFALVGLGAWVGALDYALMPLLGFFLMALGRLYRPRSGAALFLAAVALVGFAVFFGRFQPLFAALIGAGAGLAWFTHR